MYSPRPSAARRADADEAGGPPQKIRVGRAKRGNVSTKRGKRVPRGRFMRVSGDDEGEDYDYDDNVAVLVDYVDDRQPNMPTEMLCKLWLIAGLPTHARITGTQG